MTRGEYIRRLRRFEAIRAERGTPATVVVYVPDEPKRQEHS